MSSPEKRQTIYYICILFYVQFMSLKLIIYYLSGLSVGIIAETTKVKKAKTADHLQLHCKVEKV